MFKYSSVPEKTDRLLVLGTLKEDDLPSRKASGTADSRSSCHMKKRRVVATKDSPSRYRGKDLLT